VKTTNLDEVIRLLDPDHRAAFERIAVGIGAPPDAWPELPGLRNLAELATTTAVALQLLAKEPRLGRRRALEDAAHALGADWYSLRRRFQSWMTRIAKARRNSCKKAAPTGSPSVKELFSACGEDGQGAALGCHTRVDAAGRGAPPPTSWMD
jgi:hypothetical protein